jgi:hypothetical protein
MQKVTNKNTKNEILDAYEGLLQEVKDNKTNKSEEQKVRTSSQLVTKSLAQNSKDIIHNIAELKLQVNQDLENLGKSLLLEKEKLNNLQQSIETQEKYLKDVYDITVNAESLEALLLAQQRKKTEFDEWINIAKEKFTLEMSEKKTKWSKEQIEYELTQKEKQDFQKKEWKRQEEEHNYQQKTSRQQDEDQYKQKQIQQERVLAEQLQKVESSCLEREAVILAKEKEFAELAEYKANVESELEKTINKATQQLQKELEYNFKTELTIKSKESESEIALLKQNIGFLENKINDQDKTISYLNKQLSESQLQSQNLAKKVIEGNARINDVRNKNTFIQENESVDASR